MNKITNKDKQIFIEPQIELLEAIMENSRIHQVLLDINFKFVYVNSTYVKSSGYTRDQLLGKSYFDLFPSPDLMLVFNQILCTGKPVYLKAQSFKSLDRIFQRFTYWDWDITPVISKKGQTIGLILSLSDVTEEVKAKQLLVETMNHLKTVNQELEEAKRKAERHAVELNAVFAAMQDAVVIVDCKGQLKQVNPAMMDALGVDSIEEIEPEFKRIMPIKRIDEETQKTKNSFFKRVLEGLRVNDEFYQYINHKQEIKTILANSAPLIVGGTVTGSVLTWKDVTEREELLSQLQQKQNFLESVLNQMPFNVLIADAVTGKILFHNKPVDQIGAFSFSGLDSVEDLHKIQTFFKNSQPYLFENWPLIRSISHGEIIKGEEIYFDKKGSRGIISIDSAPVRNKGGNIIAGVAILHDITESKQNQEKIKLAKQMQSIIEFLPDAIFVLDQDRKVIAWNRAIEELTGVMKNEVLGKGDQIYSKAFYGKKHPMMVDNLWDNVNEHNFFVKDGDTVYSKVFIPHFNGGKGAYLEVKATPLKNDRDEIIGAIESIRDITRRQKMDEESLKIQKIESIGTLAGGIAHDFNNFLAGILANIQLAKLKHKKGDDIGATLTWVEEIVCRATHLTRQLLAFSKGGAPVKKAVLLNDVLKDTADFILRGSKSKCELLISPDLWMVEVDQGQISQVIGNLIINADQAMPEGGVIQLKADNLMVNPDAVNHLKPGRYAKISVIDQGMGIPKEIQNKIFDPFFTTKQNGTGLGLASSYFIISNHQGVISVESEVGNGTQIDIYLPALNQAVSIEKPQGQTIVEGKGRILLMDDELMVRETTGEILQEIGYEVHYAQEGMEAYQLYKKAFEKGKPFDLVIMDLTVPGGMGGQASLEVIKKFDPQVKAIVSSGYANAPVLANYREYGFVGVVVKPYKIEDLSELIHNLLSH